ncbi:hypothetical protein HDU76_002408 [Blyttiomyces sp. JEL0837]|nr:hypothetical protein HDU76_002408 [Blyttiomyces sp. JEL0837]
MTFPCPRLKPGDENNGFSYARTASKDPCQSLPMGAVKSPKLTSGGGFVDYVITAAHKDRGKGWEVIGNDPICGALPHSGSISVSIPSTSLTGATEYKAVIRFYYDTANFSGEEFNNCADVIISPQGSNAYTPGVCKNAVGITDTMQMESMSMSNMGDHIVTTSSQSRFRTRGHASSSVLESSSNNDVVLSKILVV